MADKRMEKHIDELIKRIPILSSCKNDIWNAYCILEECFEKGGKLLIAGNGGSCADAEHIAGELMKGFIKDRKLSDSFVAKLSEIDPKSAEEMKTKVQEGLPAIVLSNHQSLNTAFINDVEDGGKYLFAQQVNVYGNKDDVLFAISTSGNSKNILNAAVVAKAKGLKVVGLTGETGGNLAHFADSIIKAPTAKTHLVQEYHLPIYHCLCLMIEDHFFK